MRSLTFICLLIFGIGCAGPKNATMKPNRLNGVWVPVNQEMGGAILPQAAFATQKLVINDSNYTFTAESVDKGIVQYKDDKMDIYGKEGVNTGKHFTAIYKYVHGTSAGEKELLTICYNLAGSNYPEAFDTKGKPMYFLCVFQKEK